MAVLIVLKNPKQMASAAYTAYCFICKKKYLTTDGISCFSFPWKNKAKLDKWFASLGLDKKPQSLQPVLSSRICSLHFPRSALIINKRRNQLHPNAVPRLLAPPSESQASKPADLPEYNEILANSVSVIIKEEPSSLDFFTHEQPERTPKAAERVTEATNVLVKNIVIKQEPNKETAKTESKNANHVAVLVNVLNNQPVNSCNATPTVAPDITENPADTTKLQLRRIQEMTVMETKDHGQATLVVNLLDNASSALSSPPEISESDTEDEEPGSSQSQSDFGKSPRRGNANRLRPASCKPDESDSPSQMKQKISVLYTAYKTIRRKRHSAEQALRSLKKENTLLKSLIEVYQKKEMSAIDSDDSEELEEEREK